MGIKKIFKIRWRWYISLFITATMGAIIWNIMLGDEKVSMALVALGTLLLAAATVASIDNSKQQEKLRREQEQAIRTQEREERWLNEIINWAMDSINIAFGPFLTTEPRENTLKARLTKLANKLMQYQAIDTRSKYIKEVTNVFSEDLQNATSLVISNLNTVRADIPKALDNSRDEAVHATLNENEHKLRKSTIVLIELATNIKIKYSKMLDKD